MHEISSSNRNLCLSDNLHTFLGHCQKGTIEISCKLESVTISNSLSPLKIALWWVLYVFVSSSPLQFWSGSERKSEIVAADWEREREPSFLPSFRVSSCRLIKRDICTMFFFFFFFSLSPSGSSEAKMSTGLRNREWGGRVEHSSCCYFGRNCWNLLE